MKSSEKEALSIVRNWRKKKVLLPEGFDWTGYVNLFLETEKMMINEKEALSILRSWKKTSAMLPEGFDWAGRVDLFLEAINNDYPLPGDWDLWTKTLSIESNTSADISVAHWAAQRGYVFPDDFKFWGLKDAQGDPVIHTLLKGFWSPPASFKDWSITDNKGIPATHIYLANIRKPFPDGFDAWTVRSPIGSTAAHMAVLAAASERTPGLAWLPEDRAIWMLRDRAGWEGETVLHLAARCGVEIPAMFSWEDWEMENPDGESVIALARQGGHLHLVAQYEALVLAEQLADRPAVARISRKT